MVESDWHSGDGLDEKIWEMTELIREVWKAMGVVLTVDEETDGKSEEIKERELEETVKVLAKNWKRFMRVENGA